MSAARAIRRARQPGHLIAERYRLQSLLGRGSTASVWSAWDETAGCEVALKVLTAGASADEPTRRRFLREALAARAISHPAVVEVYGAGADPAEGAWIAMARYHGPTLAERLTESSGRWSVDECAAVMLPILDGLAKAHDAGVLHRDIKPGNIILHDNEGTPAPKLVDFGGAKLVASNDGLTATGMIFGTPHYISPEQASCTRDVDARTDVWACGVLLYRLLVGAVPFDAPNLGALISKVHTAMPTSPASLGVAPALSMVILRCLEKQADARYRDAHALKVALCAALGLPSTAGSPEHPEIAPARVVMPREAAATLRPEALVTALQSIAPANDTVPAPPLTPSQGALLMPPAPPRGSVPPEFFGARITPLRAPPPDLVRAARKMEKLHQRALLALPVPANDVLPAAPPEPDVIERVPMNSLRAMAVASTVVLALAVAWSLSMLLR